MGFSELRVGCILAGTAFLALSGMAHAQDAKPNILLIVSDDTGYGDTGPYLGGEARGMQTPNIDKLAKDGMMFTSFYAQPSCTPGRAAMQTGRIPNRSGHDHGGLPGPGRRAAGGGMDARLGAEDRRLRHLLHRQVAPRRGGLRTAERPGLRRDEVCRPLSPQRLHLRRPDLVPADARRPARDVREDHEGSALRQRRRAGHRGLQDQRPVCRHAHDRRQGGRRRHPVLRRLCGEGGARVPRRGREEARHAVVHQRELHEGAPAEHAGARVPGQVASPSRNMPTRSSSSTAASATS